MSKKDTEIYKGDAPKIFVTLKEDGSTFVIDPGDNIEVVFVFRDQSFGQKTVDLSHVDSDLANSKFVVEYTGTETGQFVTCEAVLYAKRNGNTYKVGRVDILDSVF